MPLRPPRLDDRSFDGLVAELVARIPAHTPEWTNPRVGDPGRTLIELFAWLADTILYRANLIPERQRLVFLKLLGIQLRSASPARCLVTLSIDQPQTIMPVTVRVGARVSGPPKFETAGEVTVLPLQAQIFAKRKLDESQALALGPTIRELSSLYLALSASPEGAARPEPYVTTPAFAGTPPVARGFDFVAETVDQSLWYALLAQDAANVEAIRSALVTGLAGRPFTLNVGFVPALAPIEDLSELPERRPIGHVWEVTSAEMQQGQPVYRALDVISDTTNGLTRDGVLQLALAVGSLGAPTNDLREDPLAGARLQGPPRVDDPATAARIVTWLRLRPVERLTSLAVSWSDVNAVRVDHLQTLRGVVAGQSDGTPDQTIQLPAVSIDPNSLSLQVEESERGFQVWDLVEDTTAFGRDARVYSLDAEAGTVRFGDGFRGRIPEPGKRIRVREMRAGGGAEGNVPAGTLKSINGETPANTSLGSPLKVTQALPARGGAASETLVEAEARIPAVLRHRNRAVTKEDFIELAAATPGVFVGRVEVLPRFKPQQRRPDVPGVISVMVLPASLREDVQPPAPRPDRPFLEAVHAWLDVRRGLGVELYVIGAEYVPVGVSVGVDIREGFALEETLTLVRLALRTFLWPLAPGGIAGNGWELGTNVLAAQLEVAVARVTGVSAIRGIRLFQRTRDNWAPASALPTGGVGIALKPWQLPELLSVVAVAGATAPEDLRGVPNPFATNGSSSSIAIPIVPEVC
jgi:predicted phage baseplate assembly protein